MNFRTSFKKIIFVLVIVFLVGISFFAGIYIGKDKDSVIILEKLINKNVVSKYLTKKIDFSIFWDAWGIIKNKYVKEDVSDSTLFEGVLSGLVASLNDPHSVYYNAKVAKSFTQELSGQIEGIGAEVGVRNGQLTIIAPLPDSPAEKAGLRPKDQVYAIDNIATRGLSLDYAVSLMRGKKGTEVKLFIMREGEEELREVTMIRDIIDVISVKWEMKPEEIAYLKISHFNKDTSKDFKKAVKEILIQKPKGIILDLRSNPGGYFQTAIEITNYWIAQGVIVKEELRGGKKVEYSAKDSAILKDYPTIVLVNGGSASSSEIVAGALQDYKKATLVGDETFGKGSVQRLEFLRDGSAIKLTTAKWLTPKDHQIDEIGITPDVLVKMTNEDYNLERDPQLDKAMEVLTQ